MHDTSSMSFAVMSMPQLTQCAAKACFILYQTLCIQYLVYSQDQILKNRDHKTKTNISGLEIHLVVRW